MAIVGLHNVPVLEPTILRESQPSSSSSGHRNQRRISTTRASSILQMWLELEDECAVNRANERGRLRSPRENIHSLSNGQEDIRREALEDECVVSRAHERGRLRSPREHIDSLSNGQGEIRREALEDLSESENGSVSNPRSQVGVVNENEDRLSMTSEQSQDLGEVERERVRQIFQEWMNSGVTAQQRSHIPLLSRAQLLGENERERVRIVREWIQMTSQQRDALAGNREEQVGEIGSQINRVRDGLVRDQNEGQAENSRRGIRRLCGRQALLDLLAKKEQEKRLELQRLRETQPVSSFAHRNRIQSLLRTKCFQYTRSVELTRPSSARETELGLLRQRQTVSGLREGFLSRLDNNANAQASDLPEGPSDCLREDEMQGSSSTEILDSAHEQNELNGDDEVGSSGDLNQLSECSIGDTNLPELTVQVGAGQGRALDNVEPARQEIAVACHSSGSSDAGIPMLNAQEASRSERVEFNNSEESHETFRQHNETEREEIDIHTQSHDVEGDVSGDVNGEESSTHVEDWQEDTTVYEEREQEGSVLSNQWRYNDQVEIDRQLWPGDGEESSHGVSENLREQNDAQEDYWHENASQETPRDWMGLPSGPGATSSGRVDTYYFSDDDNLYNMELRELLNRRTVSSLLHSGFRESLDQLIQSYVERQTHAPDDWELHEMSPPPFAARHQEHQGTDLHESGAGEGSRQVLRRPPASPHGHWGYALPHANRSRHDIRQRTETEWEIINDLRIDMARLQQRLNSMQKMLETCMDMQIELQRSVRQEVSAALNRSTNQSELLESIPPRDSSKWDCVRKGICCICSDSNIDSLLYRCGHMCTCTKCANVLVQGNGKCPMCQAPIIEVIRAFFIQ